MSDARLMVLALANGQSAQLLNDLVETGSSVLKKPLSVAERDELIRLASANGLCSLVHHQVRQGVDDPELLDALGELARPAALRRLHMRGELVRILRYFAAHDLPVIGLKGPLLAELHYRAPHIRDFGDLDLLVRPEECSRAMVLMGELGYASPYKNNDLYQRYHIVYRRQTTGEYVELHWRIAGYEYPDFKDGAFLWQDAAPREAFGMAVLTPRNEAVLIYLCIHAYKHDWSRLQWVRDIAELIVSAGPLDWSWIWQNAARQHALGAVQASIQLALQLFPKMVVLPPEALPKRFPLGVARLSLVLEGIFGNDAQPRKLRRLLLLRAALMDTWRDRWRLFCVRITPSDRDREFVRVPRHMSALYWVLRPFRILRMLWRQWRSRN